MGVQGTFGALAEPTRRAVVQILREGPRRPSELADVLGTSRASMSRHLGVLRRAGLVREQILEHDARARSVTLLPGPFTELRTWLDEVEGFWADQLSSFAQHAETVHKDEP